MGSIGDVARGLSLAVVLRRAFPSARLTWLVEPKSSGIVVGHPALDEVILFERNRGWRGLGDLRRALRSRRFDLALDLQRHLKSGLFSWWSGAPRRIGFHRRNAKEFNWLFSNEQIEFLPDTVSKIEHYLAFARALGVSGASVEPGLGHVADLPPPPVLGGWSGYLALVLGSAWPSKDWPAAGYHRLVELITGAGQQVVLLGDRRQGEFGESLVRSAPAGTVLNLAGRTSLAEVPAILARAALCIGPDSGPGHIAAAVGTRAVTIFGPTAPARTAPWGSEHLVVQSSIGCSPCYRRTCPGLGTMCMRLIPAERVWERALEALREKA